MALTRPRFVRHALARNTLWMMASQGARLLLEAGYFILIARSLGAAQYGAFAGVRALVLIVAPFAGLGSGNLLVKNVSRNRALTAEYWGNALVVSLVTGSVLTIAMVSISTLVFATKIPPLLVLVVAVADLLFRRVFDAAGQAFQAVEQLHRTAQLDVTLGVARLLAAVALAVLVPHPSALAWAALYLASLAGAALWSIRLVHRLLGAPQSGLHRIRPELVEGLFFSVGTASQTVYNDIDKTMLTRLSTLGAVGIYAAAYRLIDVSFVPVRALVYAAQARFFRHGEAGLGGSVRFAKRLIPLSAGYGLAAGVALFLLAPLVPYILGAQYTSTVEAVRWLAPLPLLKSVHYFAADALTAAGHQGTRSGVQLAIAGVNVALNLWLIPPYSWRGAAWASVASDALLVLTLWATVVFLHRHEAGGRASVECG